MFDRDKRRQRLHAPQPRPHTAPPRVANHSAAALRHLHLCILLLSCSKATAHPYVNIQSAQMHMRAQADPHDKFMLQGLTPPLLFLCYPDNLAEPAASASASSTATATPTGGKHLLCPRLLLMQLGAPRALHWRHTASSSAQAGGGSLADGKHGE